MASDNMSDSTIKITLLVDDRAQDDLAAEHGLSFLVETAGRRILFDTGQGEALPENAERLGVELASVDTVVLSHGHYDHTGGLPHILIGRSNVDLYFHPDVFRMRYTATGGATRQIGIPTRSVSAIEGLAGRCLHAVTGDLLLQKDLGLVAPIVRETDFEDTGGAFFLDAKASSPDPIEDDMAMWIRTGEGLVLLAGCCHAGIINTLSHVKRVAGEQRIRAIIGGLHLLHADYRRLDQTVAALQAAAPHQLIPCHCTGDRAVQALQDSFGGRVCPGASGAVWQF